MKKRAEQEKNRTRNGSMKEREPGGIRQGATSTSAPYTTWSFSTTMPDSVTLLG